MEGEQRLCILQNFPRQLCTTRCSTDLRPDDRDARAMRRALVCDLMLAPVLGR